MAVKDEEPSLAKFLSDNPHPAKNLALLAFEVDYYLKARVSVRTALENRVPTGELEGMVDTVTIREMVKRGITK